MQCLSACDNSSTFARIWARTNPLRLSMGIAFLILRTFSPCPSSAKDLRLHGFVTAVNSPTNFEIDDYKITTDPRLTIDVKTKSDVVVATFKLEDIRVGTELEITGDHNEST